MTKSLHARQSHLADPREQLNFLSNGIFRQGGLPSFAEKIRGAGVHDLRPIVHCDFLRADVPLDLATARRLSPAAALGAFQALENALPEGALKDAVERLLARRRGA